MRNEGLIGYLLHQRPYQEKRALYYLFSQQHGVIHGIGKKGAPLFEPLQLFATGKRDLKTFSQINVTQVKSAQTAASVLEPKPASASLVSYQKIQGQHQYAALYLNELLWRLLPTEDPMPLLWQRYQDSLQQLKQPLTSNELRLTLRQFEHHLFNELGFGLNLTHDNLHDLIEAEATYRFIPDVGLVAIAQDIPPTNIQAPAVFKGSDLLMMVEMGIAETTLNSWSRLYRQLIDHLLDYQPLQSRMLWQQQQRYQ